MTLIQDNQEGQSECAHLLYMGQQLCWQWHQNRQLEHEYLPPYLCIQALTQLCRQAEQKVAEILLHGWCVATSICRPFSKMPQLRTVHDTQAMFRLCLQLARVTLIARPLLDFILQLWRKISADFSQIKSGSGLGTRLSKSSCLGRTNDSIVLSHLLGYSQGVMTYNDTSVRSC